MEVAGKGGSIACAGLTKGVKSWSLNLVGDTLETTDYADSGHRTFIAGIDGWTGSCEVNWDTANSGLEVGATIAALAFTIAAAEHYDGAAIVTGISVSSAVDGLVTMTVNFQGSGVCTLTSAA